MLDSIKRYVSKSRVGAVIWAAIPFFQTYYDKPEKDANKLANLQIRAAIYLVEFAVCLPVIFGMEFIYEFIRDGEPRERPLLATLGLDLGVTAIALSLVLAIAHIFDMSRDLPGGEDD